MRRTRPQRTGLPEGIASRAKGHSYLMDRPNRKISESQGLSIIREKKGETGARPISFII